METQRISIIGIGNVGKQLLKGFSRIDIEVSHVYSTSFDRAKEYNVTVVKNIDELPNQLTIVCVPDDAIQSVLDQLHGQDVAYTSGSVDLNSISYDGKIGVFYPLQTFSRKRDIVFDQLPFFIEGRDEYIGSVLFDLAWKLSSKVQYANSETRAKLHVSAVWVNNFVNHIILQSEELCKSNGVSFEHLIPLLKETISKAIDIGPFESQTGPARRLDKQTMDKHMQMMNSSNQKEIYRLISESIMNTYNDELQGKAE